jgi:hypothetical protein
MPTAARTPSTVPWPPGSAAAARLRPSVPLPSGAMAAAEPSPVAARPVVAAARAGRRSPGKAVATAVGVRDDNPPPTELVEPVAGCPLEHGKAGGNGRRGQWSTGQEPQMAASVG